MAPKKISVVLVGDDRSEKREFLCSVAKLCSVQPPVQFHDFVIPVNYVGEIMDLHVYDTIGQSDYSSIPRPEVVVICYSCVHKDSFEDITAKFFAAVKNAWKDLPMLLLAATNLRSRSSYRLGDEGSYISDHEGSLLATKLSASHFAEVDIEDLQSVDNYFRQVFRLADQASRKKRKSIRKSFFKKSRPSVTMGSSIDFSSVPTLVTGFDPYLKPAPQTLNLPVALSNASTSQTVVPSPETTLAPGSVAPRKSSVSLGPAPPLPARRPSVADPNAPPLPARRPSVAIDSSISDYGHPPPLPARRPSVSEPPPVPSRRPSVTSGVSPPPLPARRPSVVPEEQGTSPSCLAATSDEPVVAVRRPTIETHPPPPLEPQPISRRPSLADAEAPLPNAYRRPSVETHPPPPGPPPPLSNQAFNISDSLPPPLPDRRPSVSGPPPPLPDRRPSVSGPPPPLPDRRPSVSGPPPPLPDRRPSVSGPPPPLPDRRPSVSGPPPTLPDRRPSVSGLTESSVPSTLPDRRPSVSGPPLPNRRPSVSDSTSPGPPNQSRAAGEDSTVSTMDPPPPFGPQPTQRRPSLTADTTLPSMEALQAEPLSDLEVQLRTKAESLSCCTTPASTPAVSPRAGKGIAAPVSIVENKLPVADESEPNLSLLSAVGSSGTLNSMPDVIVTSSRDHSNRGVKDSYEGNAGTPSERIEEAIAVVPSVSTDESISETPQPIIRRSSRTHVSPRSSIDEGPTMLLEARTQLRQTPNPAPKKEQPSIAPALAPEPDVETLPDPRDQQSSEDHLEDLSGFLKRIDMQKHQTKLEQAGLNVGKMRRMSAEELNVSLKAAGLDMWSRRRTMFAFEG